MSTPPVAAQLDPSMRSSRPRSASFPSVLWLAGALLSMATPLRAQPTTPCTVMPFYDFDGVAENLLGIAPGFVGEYCQRIDLTSLVQGPMAELCTNEGGYFVVETTHGYTRDGGAAAPIEAEISLRTVQSNGTPNPAVGTRAVFLGPPPSFPAEFEFGYIPYDHEWGLIVIFDAGELYWNDDDDFDICRRWDGNDSTQALPADVGPGPVQPIHASFDGGKNWEVVQDFAGFEDFRSVMMGTTIAPMGSSMTSVQVVPRDENRGPPSTAGGTVGMWEESPGIYTLRAVHEVESPTGVGLFRGGFGEPGVLLQDLAGGDATSPVDGTYTPPDAESFRRDLRAGRLYVEVDSNSLPAIRGQIVLMEHQFLPEPLTYSVRLGLTHPGSTACYSVHHSGTGDESVAFDQIKEELQTYLNGTLPQIDENQTPRGADRFRIQLVLSTALGPMELFPSGFLEPGTGTPLTDGCLVFGGADPLDSNHPVTLDSYQLTDQAGDAPASSISLRTLHTGAGGSDEWSTSISFRLSGAAGAGLESLGISIETTSGLFVDGFESGDTSGWGSL